VERQQILHHRAAERFIVAELPAKRLSGLTVSLVGACEDTDRARTFMAQGIGMVDFESPAFGQYIERLSAQTHG
jgi:hypothetical protein